MRAGKPRQRPLHQPQINIPLLLCLTLVTGGVSWVYLSLRHSGGQQQRRSVTIVDSTRGNNSSSSSSNSSRDTGGRQQSRPLPAGLLFSWGLDSAHRLGRSGGDTSFPAPALTHLQVVAAAASRHTLLLTASGAVVSAGFNNSAGGGGHGSQAMPDSGQLGRGGSQVAAPVEGLPQGVRVVSIAAGRYHSLAATADGHVYSWGLNDWGQLGRTGQMGHQPAAAVEDSEPGSPAGEPCTHGARCHSGRPGLVAALQGVSVRRVAAGRYSSFALDAAGNLHAWGFEGCSSGGAVPAAAAAWRPRLVQGELQGHVVAHVSIGYTFWAAATSTGRVFTCAHGDDGYAGTLPSQPAPNAAGQLGRPGAPHLPGQVQLPAAERVVGVAAGREHALVVTAAGRVYSWGGRGGAGGRQGGHVLVEGALKGVVVQAVAAGEYYSVAASNNTLFGWGNNGYGTTGVGGTAVAEVPTPTPVQGLLGGSTWHISQLAAGYQHALAVADRAPLEHPYGVQQQPAPGKVTVVLSKASDRSTPAAAVVEPADLAGQQQQQASDSKSRTAAVQQQQQQGVAASQAATTTSTTHTTTAMPAVNTTASMPPATPPPPAAGTPPAAADQVLASSSSDDDELVPHQPQAADTSVTVAASNLPPPSLSAAAAASSPVQQAAAAGVVPAGTGPQAAPAAIKDTPVAGSSAQEDDRYAADDAESPKNAQKRTPTTQQQQQQLLANPQQQQPQQLQQGQQQPAAQEEEDHVSYLAAQSAGPRYEVASYWAGWQPSPLLPLVRARSADVFEGLPEQYNNETKNPCWGGLGPELKCLPYFNIIGVSKCGTTDLYSRLTQHQLIPGAFNKGPHFWDECPYPPKGPCGVGTTGDFSGYVTLFNGAADLIRRQPRQAVTGEASSNTFTSANRVYLRGPVSRDQGLRVSLPLLLREAQPYLRLVLMLRDPVERYQSAFYYYRWWAKDKPVPTPDEFHQHVVQEIATWQQCLRDNANSSSSNSNSSDNTTPANSSQGVSSQGQALAACVRGYHPQQLVKGMYSQFLQDWLTTWPRQQLLILRYEDYIADTPAHLKAVLSFLGVPEPEPHIWERMVSAAVKNKNKKGYKPMRQDTRELLQQLYAPLNAELAAALQDQRFGWGAPTQPGAAAGPATATAAAADVQAAAGSQLQLLLLQRQNRQ